jgi:ATP-dependent Clp protease ATP-binding subunit ClpC
MYERFTDRARKVMWLAGQAARQRNCEVVDCDHLLIGLIEEADGVAARVLRDLGADLARVRAAADARIEPSVEPLVATAPAQRGWFSFIRRWLSPVKSPQAAALRNAIEAAMGEARALRHNYIGTEHLLLGLLRQADSGTARILIEEGLSLDAARRGTLDLLGIRQGA